MKPSITNSIAGKAIRRIVIQRIAVTAIVLTICAWPSLLHANSLSSDVLSMFPKDVGEFAYADLRAARAFSWFPQLKEQMLPARFRQFETFLASAGINPNSQVEELAWALVPTASPNKLGATSAVPQSDEVVGVAPGAFQPDTAQELFRSAETAGREGSRLFLVRFRQRQRSG